MDEDQFQANVHTLKELILDEQKLITYVTLSKDLCIHINDSKRLLAQFQRIIKKEQPAIDLNVCYIISGLTEENTARTTVVPESEKDDIRKGLKLVFYEHVYSVSKGLPCLDSAAFLAVNKFDDFPLCSGLIKSSSCVKRSVDEIGKLKSSSQVSLQVDSKPIAVPTKKIKEEIKGAIKNGHEEQKVITKVHESKSEPSIKTELHSPKKETSSSSNSKPKPDVKKNGIKAQKGIAGFFNKSNSAPSKILCDKVKPESTVRKEKANETKSVVKEKTEKKTVAKEKLETIVEKMDVDEQMQNKVNVKETKIKPEKTPQQNGKSKSLSQIRKTAKIDKKRKRVLHVSDSESDDEKDPFVDEPEAIQQESDDEIPPTPAGNTVKITSGILNPKKRAKIVDKTYTDEEGYILTKKVKVYESCSDKEEESSIKENVKAPPPVNQVKQETSPKDKKTAPKNSKKKISPPQKGKQATLMNFFKKI